MKPLWQRRGEAGLNAELPTNLYGWLLEALVLCGLKPLMILAGEWEEDE